MSTDVDEGWISNLMAMIERRPRHLCGGTFFRCALIYATENGVSRPMMAHRCPGGSEIKRKKNKAGQRTTVT